MNPVGVFWTGLLVGIVIAIITLLIRVVKK